MIKDTDFQITKPRNTVDSWDNFYSSPVEVNYKMGYVDKTLQIYGIGLNINTYFAVNRDEGRFEHYAQEAKYNINSHIYSDVLESVERLISQLNDPKTTRFDTLDALYSLKSSLVNKVWTK